MKEVEMDALVMPWANARVAHLLSVHRMMTMEVGDGLKEKSDPDGYEQLMYTQNVETIEPFSSHIIPVKAGRAYTGEHINVMVQALWTEDGSLPQGLTVQNMYTKLRQGNKKAIVVVRNNMAYSQTLQKKTPVARAVAVLPVPKPPEEVQLQEGADKPQDSSYPQTDSIDKDMVNCFMNWTWVAWIPGPPELVDAACWLLAKYHNIFSLDPVEFGCTHSKEHMNKSYGWHSL